MRKPLQIIAILALTLQSAFAQNAATQEGRLEMIHSFSERHPGFITENLQYRRSPYALLKNSVGIQKKLGSAAADLKWVESPILAIDYTTANEARYDVAKISEFRNQLQRTLSEIDPAYFKLSLAEGIEKSLTEKGPVQKSAVQRWLKLSPVIYNSEGTLLVNDASAAKSLLEGLSDADLDNRYSDLLPNHLMPKITQANETAAYRQYLNSFQNQFLGRETQSTFAMKSVTGESAVRKTIYLEKIPPQLALFRGSFGGDCSMLSVPYYPMVEGTDTYWIYKDQDFKSKPKGYALVTQVEKNGKKVPYIVTINGSSVTHSDTQAIVRMIADHHQVNEVIVPDFKQSPHVINYAPIKKGLATGSEAAVEVKFSKAWDQADLNSMGFGDYYASKALKNARVLSIANLEVKSLKSYALKPSLFYSQMKGQFKNLPLIERAVLSGYLVSEANLIEKLTMKMTLRKLGLNSEQARAGKILLEKTPKMPLTAKEFSSLEKSLNFTMADVEKLDVFTRSSSLVNLHQQNPGLASAEEWSRMADRAHRALFKQLPAEPASDQFSAIRQVLQNDAELSSITDGKNLIEAADYVHELEKKGHAISDFYDGYYKAFRKQSQQWGASLTPELEKRVFDETRSLAFRKSMSATLLSNSWFPPEEKISNVLELTGSASRIENSLSGRATLAYRGASLYEKRFNGSPAKLPSFYSGFTNYEKGMIATAGKFTPELAEGFGLNRKNYDQAFEFDRLIHKVRVGQASEIEMKIVAELARDLKVSGAAMLGTLNLTDTVNYLHTLGWIKNYAPTLLTPADLREAQLSLKKLLMGEVKTDTFEVLTLLSNYTQIFGHDPDFKLMLDNTRYKIQFRFKWANELEKIQGAHSAIYRDWMLNEAFLNPNYSLEDRMKSFEYLFVSYDQVMGREIDQQLAIDLKAKLFSNVMKNNESRPIILRSLELMAKHGSNHKNQKLMLMKQEIKKLYPTYAEFLAVTDHSPPFATQEFKTWYEKPQAVIQVNPIDTGSRLPCSTTEILRKIIL